MPLGPSGEGCSVLVTQSGNLLELNRHGAGERASWVAGDAIVRDGCIYMATPLDAALVLLPLLEANAEQREGLFISLGELLKSQRFPWISESAELFVPSLAQICTTQRALPKKGGERRISCVVMVAGTQPAGAGVEGETYARLEKERIVPWLVKKAEKVAQAAGRATGLPSEFSPKAYAVGIMSEYLTDQRLADLCSSMGIEEKQRELAWAGESLERPADEGREEGSRKKQAKSGERQSKQPSKKEAERAKAAQGTQKLSKFFGKKS